MKDTLIQYDTAVLAKEKNFLVYTDYWFENTKETGITTNNYGLDRNYPRKEIELCSIEYPGEEGTEDYIKLELDKDDSLISYEKGFYFAPTQSLLQKWLREVHNIHVSSDINEEGTWDFVLIDIKILTCMFNSLNTDIAYNTYELALEEGLKQALLLIK